jgi:hypothetical protein
MGGRIINLDRGPKYINAGLKVGWAKHHLRALDKEIGKYLRDEPYLIATQDDLETGEYVVSLGAKPITSYPSDERILTVTDC